MDFQGFYETPRPAGLKPGDLLVLSLCLRTQVVVHPSGPWVDVQLMHMPIDADEVDVLAVVAAPVPIERTRGRRCSAVGQGGEVVVHPSGP